MKLNTLVYSCCCFVVLLYGCSPEKESIDPCSNYGYGSEICRDHELRKLPAQSRDGENTFGALIDGKAWVPNGLTSNWAEIPALRADYYFNQNYFYLEGYFADGAGVRSKRSSITLILQSFEMKTGVYDLNASSDTLGNSAILAQDHMDHSDCLMSSEFFEARELEANQLEIEFVDSIEQIISGSFSFFAFSDSSNCQIEISNGRFDANYNVIYN